MLTSRRRRMMAESTDSLGRKMILIVFIDVCVTGGRGRTKAYAATSISNTLFIFNSGER